MIYGIINHNGKEQLCCIDKIGRRAFLTEEFFDKDLTQLCISSNHPESKPETMNGLIRSYNALWTDDMALFFGNNPELGIPLDPEKAWTPLVKPDEIWSPLSKVRGVHLLE